MNDKRLIGVIAIKSGIAIQSIEFKRYLPLGRPEYLVENLARWEIDEILVLSIDRTINNLGPDIDLISRISNYANGTPIIYGGGISNVEEAINAIRSGADRIALTALIIDSPDSVKQIARIVGVQAVIACIPVKLIDAKLFYYDYRVREFKVFNSKLLKFLDSEFISEIILMDVDGDGVKEGFNYEIINSYGLDKPLIVYGGLSPGILKSSILESPQISAIAVGNFLNYSEFSPDIYRKISKFFVSR
jgi:cyclase